MRIKRTRSEVECEFCGRRFMQTRWWQVFCSKECLKNSEKTAKATLKKVLPELEYLRKRVKELERNALDHFQRPEPFKYDNENQAIGWEE